MRDYYGQNLDMEDLLEEYEFETADEYYEYIIDSKLNGQNQQVREFFGYLSEDNQSWFLNDYLDNDNTTHQKVKRICINSLI